MCDEVTICKIVLEYCRLKPLLCALSDVCGIVIKYMIN